jgi:hypothetical protein
MSSNFLSGNSINLKNNLFSDTIFNLLQKFSIEEIIETGTFNGLGSTSVFAKSGIKTISIESCFEHYEAAKENLKEFNNVELHHALSLSLIEMEKFITEDDIYYSDLVLSGKLPVDGGHINNSQNFYLNEVRGFSGKKAEIEDFLFPLINNSKKQLVFLDSAGGVGFLEFKKFMTLEETFLKNKILVLDDVSHVKHYRSVVFLKQNNYEVSVSSDGRFAYCNFE